LIVFGATGATGKLVIDQAIAAGHVVTAFVRSPDYKAPPGVNVVTGSVLDAVAVTGAIRGHDAVFSGLGTKPWRHEDICSQGTAVIAAAMKQVGVRRLVVMSSQGVGDSEIGGVAGSIAGALLRKSFRDKGVMEQALAATELDWTVLRPGMLTNGTARGTWRTGEHREVIGGKIARADVAAFALRELADNAWVRKCPSVVW
jgi:uncharacterized protein YbjT (DUF2867 family)